MRWSENETYQFVKLYIKNEILWNPENNDYKLKNKRLKAYREFIAEFNEKTGIVLNETELKIKIKNLRSTYVQEKGKIKQRSKANWNYIPNMKWFSEWHTHIGKKQSGCEISYNQQDSTEEVLEDPSQKVWLSQGDSNIEHEPMDPFPTDDEYTIILKSEPTDVPLMNKTKRFQSKKSKIKHRSPSTDYSDRNFRSSLDTEQVRLDTANEDEFDIYGKYIASQLRKMDLQKALRVQLEIQGLVSEARIADINDKQ